MLNAKTSFILRENRQRVFTVIKYTNLLEMIDCIKLENKCIANNLMIAL